MQLARDELFARAGLAGDQHRCVAGCDALESRQQCPRQRVLENQGFGADRERAGNTVGQSQHHRRITRLLHLVYYNRICLGIPIKPLTGEVSLEKLPR